MKFHVFLDDERPTAEIIKSIPPGCTHIALTTRNYNFSLHAIANFFANLPFRIEILELAYFSFDRYDLDVLSSLRQNYAIITKIIIYPFQAITYASESNLHYLAKILPGALSVEVNEYDNADLCSSKKIELFSNKIIEKCLQLFKCLDKKLPESIISLINSYLFRPEGVSNFAYLKYKRFFQTFENPKIEYKKTVKDAHKIITLNSFCGFGSIFLRLLAELELKLDRKLPKLVVFLVIIIMQIGYWLLIASGIIINGCFLERCSSYQLDIEKLYIKNGTLDYSFNKLLAIDDKEDVCNKQCEHIVLHY